MQRKSYSLFAWSITIRTTEFDAAVPDRSNTMPREKFKREVDC